MAQDNWRWCQDCSVLFYAGGNKGRCPGTGAQHNIAGSGNYSLKQGPENGQDDWRWCKSCQELHYHGHKGHCLFTGDSGHSIDGSGNYALKTTASTPGTQSGWKWCKKCGGLWYSASGGNRCSYGGQHTFDGSGDYELHYA